MNKKLLLTSAIAGAVVGVAGCFLGKNKNEKTIDKSFMPLYEVPMDADLTKYSVLMSVYKNDVPEYVKQAVDSMLNQSLPCNQFVIVEDGPISDELELLIKSYEENHPQLFTVVRLEENGGLGNALNQGMKVCRNELVARMDADDISMLNRCEKQIKEYRNNPGLSVVGTQINEFVGEKENVVSLRKVPIDMENIIKFSKRRSPFNHVTVMYRKSTVESFGGYATYNRKEDLELFVKMVNNGIKVMTIDEALVYVRIGEDNLRRRRSWINCKEYIDIMYRFYKQGYLRISDMIYVLAGQTAMFILPRWILQRLNKTFLRGGK